MRSLAPAHISDRARAGLDHFVAQAVKGSLAAGGAGCTVTPTDADAAVGGHEVLMFTVSSYMFRVLLFMHCERSPAMRSHLAALAHVEADAIDESRFTDELLERGNLCCGALNRDLAHHFPHIGMSTPCILKHGSAEHVGAVKPTLQRRYHAELGDGVGMQLTLAVCAFEDLDFPYEANAVVEEDTAGELELF